MAHIFLNLVMVFLTRHWLVAITNAALTAVLGLGLLRWARKWPGLGFSSLQFLRLRRFVLLTALYKGALFLLLGLSFHRGRLFPLVYGIQFPDPREVFLLVPIDHHSIWFPTSASKVVSLLLVGGATFFLMRRGFQVIRSMRALRSLLRLGSHAGSTSGNTNSTSEVLERAAATMGLLESQKLPAILLAEVPYPTPMLVGLRRPYILLAPRLVHLLSEFELEMALRHELAHFQRRDHWGRWLFSWMEDVGRLNMLSGRLGSLALDLEEELCDRMAVHTPQDAFVLASAIRKSVLIYQDKPPRTTVAFLKKIIRTEIIRTEINGREQSPPITPLDATAHENKVPEIVLPSIVLPALLGRHTQKWSRPSTLSQRLRGLLATAREVTAQQDALSREAAVNGSSHQKGRSRQIRAAVLRLFSQVAFGILMFLIVYIKFYVAIDLSAMGHR